MLKDTGNRVESAYGALSDPGLKPRRYDLIPPQALRRLAEHYGNGAKKYLDWNWAKGFPYSVCQDKLMSHLERWREGWTDEDHLAAVAFWTFALMYFEEMGRGELDDRFLPGRIEVPVQGSVGVGNEPSATEVSPEVALKYSEST
jgi:hypothetical protein